MATKGAQALSAVVYMLKVPLWDDWLEKQISHLPAGQQVAIHARMEWNRRGLEIVGDYDIVAFIRDKLRNANLPYDEASVHKARFEALTALRSAYLADFGHTLSGEE